jgi:hypothetical protein
MIVLALVPYVRIFPAPLPTTPTETAGVHKAALTMLALVRV